jgi:RimJ/RimL family protein N-acetyltransferase
MDEQREQSDESGLSAEAQVFSITTVRLVLRSPEPKDAKPFAEMANNMAIASQMSSLPHPYSEKNAEGWIAEVQTNTEPNKVSFVVTLKDGTIAGAVGVRPSASGESEMSYFL